MLRATTPSTPPSTTAASSPRSAASLPLRLGAAHQENPTLLHGARQPSKRELAACMIQASNSTSALRPGPRGAATKRVSVAATRGPYRAGAASSRCHCCSAEREAPVAVPANHACKLSAVAAAHTARRRSGAGATAPAGRDGDWRRWLREASGHWGWMRWCWPSARSRRRAAGLTLGLALHGHGPWRRPAQGSRDTAEAGTRLWSGSPSALQTSSFVRRPEPLRARAHAPSRCPRALGRFHDAEAATADRVI